jgi:hypothetical protein
VPHRRSEGLIPDSPHTLGALLITNRVPVRVPPDGSRDPEALALKPEEWRTELPLIEEWFAKIGDKVPTALTDELDALRHRLDQAT